MSSGSFSTRNTYYLRISRDTVLSLYVYLEPAYTDWMTDYTLQKVLLALRPLIRPKIEAEALNDKKTASNPEVIVGDDFRFCFFLRSNADDRHVVLLKDRHYVARSLNGQREETASPEPERPSEVESRTRETRGMKRAREPSEEGDVVLEVKPEEDEGSAIDDLLASSADNTRDAPRGQGLFDFVGTEQADMDGVKEEEIETAGGFVAAPDEEEVEEKKFKPALEMHYQGFSIYASSLVVIVEPYPLPRATPGLRRSTSLSVPPTPRPRLSSTFSTSTSGTRRTFDRTPSASPWPSRPAANSRSGTPAVVPLFERGGTLAPDDDALDAERREDEMRRRWASWRDRSLSVVPSREDSAAPAGEGVGGREGEQDEGGMVNLTQSLLNVGGRDGVQEGEE